MSLPMYPYTNMSDTNLDWLIADNKRVHVEMKETTEYIDKSKTYIDGKLEDATTQAENAQSAQALAENARDSAANSATAAAGSATAAAGSATQAAQTVANTLSQVSLLQSRVDNIIPSGTQTEGNTELIDIRVGANGVTYSSAGDAVRRQVSDLKSDLSEVLNLSLTHKKTVPGNWATGQYRQSDGEIRAESSRIRMYDYLNDDVQFIVSIDSSYKLILAAWNKSDNSYIGWWNGSVFETSGETVLSQTLNINTIRSLYPNYKFKLMVQHTSISIATAIQYIVFNTPTPFVSPLMFGAAGDGVTDDSDAIQKCMDSSCNIVVIPNGTYLISKPIIIAKDKTIIGGNKSIIHMPGQVSTTYMFTAAGVSLFVSGLTFTSTRDQSDASIFERDRASVFSNVRGFLIESCANVTIDRCTLVNLESLMFADIGSGSGNGSITVSNCDVTYTQMFMFASNVKDLLIDSCVIRHSNSSRLDHTFYFAHDNKNITIQNVKSSGCKGISFHLYAVEGYANTFEKAYINNCVISAQNGCIVTMYGDAFINGGVFECTASNSMALRNKGGNMTCIGSVITSCDYLLYSEKGSGANPDAVPNTKFKGIDAECKMIEGFQDSNIVGGKRSFSECNIIVNRTGSFDGAIICEEPTAEYEIVFCNIKKSTASNISALLYSESGVNAKIMHSVLSEGLSIYDGLTDDVVACNNIAYIEKGSSSTGDGLFEGNIILNT